MQAILKILLCWNKIGAGDMSEESHKMAAQGLRESLSLLPNESSAMFKWATALFTRYDTASTEAVCSTLCETSIQIPHAHYAVRTIVAEKRTSEGDRGPTLGCPNICVQERIDYRSWEVASRRGNIWRRTVIKFLASAALRADYAI